MDCQTLLLPSTAESSYREGENYFDDTERGGTNHLPADTVSGPSVCQHEGFGAIRSYWAAKQQEHRKRTKKRTIQPWHIDDQRKQNICKAVARCWVRQTQGIDTDTQKEVFNLLLQHPKFRDLQPQILQYDAGFMDNIRRTLSQVKRPRSKNELFLKRSMCLSLINSADSAINKPVSLAKAAKFLGVHKRNLSAAQSRLNMEEDGVLALETCQRQPTLSNIITAEIKDSVYAFWTSETRVSPNKKDVCRKRIGRGAVVVHPVHLLDEPQSELFKRFKTIHPNFQISLRCFEGLKPFFVRQLKDRYTCCCIGHVQMMFLKDAFNLMRQKLHDRSCVCTCSICVKDAENSSCTASKSVYSGVTSCWESLLCPKATDSAFHDRKCIYGACSQCGTKILALCPIEMSNMSLLLPVKVFQDIETGIDENGKNKKRKDLLVVQMGCLDFISYFKEKIRSFIVHNFIYRWQSQQFKDCLTMFPDDVVVSVIDFAENYSFKEQNEIQSMHWYCDQVTILVHISYIRVNHDVKKTYHFYISDDKNHDTLFVQHCLMLHERWLKDKRYELKRHWVWSDGCAAQFKAKRPFYFVARYFAMTGLEMLWNFPCSGHGKGEHDGAGAVIKREMTHEQLNPNGCVLKCAHNCVDFLRKRFSNSDVHRVFWEIKLGDVLRENKWDCKRIQNSRSMHSVNGYSPTNTCALRSRALSCFCDQCMDGRWRRCRNKQFVQNWEYHTIEPLAAADGSEDSCSGDEEDSCSSDEEDSSSSDTTPVYAGQPDALSDALLVGDNFAVNVENNENGAEFFIVRCTSTKERLNRARSDNWGNVLPARSMIVVGTYYERVHKDVWQLLLDSPPVLMYSHLVRAIKFHMEPIPGHPNHYRLDAETEENIYNSMPFNI